MKLILVLWYCLALAAAAPGYLFPPSQDPWYKPPTGYELAQPGAVLQIRNTPLKLKLLVATLNLAGAWQVMYRTTDQHGNPSYAVTTIVQPFNANPDNFITYSMAEDSGSPDCAPSYALEVGADDNNSLKLESIFLVMLLQKGWYVSIPDYEGPQAWFLLGKNSGYAVLDSIRAVYGLVDATGISANAATQLFGYSGGSFALGWAIQEQPTYAPELQLKILGCVIGGVLANIISSVTKVDGTSHSGFIPVGFGAMAKAYPESESILLQAFGANWVNFLQSQTMCSGKALSTYKNQYYFYGNNPMGSGGVDILRDATINGILTEQIMGRQVPQVPVMIYQSEADEVINSNSVDQLVDQWARGGISSLEYNSATTGKHGASMVWGAPMTIKWLGDRFSGVSPVQGARKTTRKSNLTYPGVDSSILKLVFQQLGALLGVAVGPLTQSGFQLDGANTVADVQSQADASIDDSNNEKVGGPISIDTQAQFQSSGASDSSILEDAQDHLDSQLRILGL